MKIIYNMAYQIFISPFLPLFFTTEHGIAEAVKMVSDSLPLPSTSLSYLPFLMQTNGKIKINPLNCSIFIQNFCTAVQYLNHGRGHGLQLLILLII